VRRSQHLCDGTSIYCTSTPQFEQIAAELALSPSSIDQLLARSFLDILSFFDFINIGFHIQIGLDVLNYVSNETHCLRDELII
jgi:hypothetical protein